MKRRKGEEGKKIPLYQRCVKCESHAYLTVGKFYYCTNKDCLYKDYLNIDDKTYQANLDLGKEDE